MNNWELTVIGTALYDPTSMAEANDLTPSDFTGTNQLVWTQILALHQRNALDRRSVIEALRAEGQLEDVGTDIGDPDVRGEAYLEQCLSHWGIRMTEYARQVADHSVKRQLKATAALIAADSMISGKDADILLDEAERRIMALRRKRGHHGTMLGDIITTFMPTLQGMRDGTITPAIVPHLQAVKDIVDFIDYSDFVLIAGRPGSGKSSYLRFEAYHLARRGYPGIMFNLENDESEYAKAAIALHTGIDSKLLRNPRLLSVAQLEKVREAGAELASLPLEVISLGSPSVTEIERIARGRMSTLKPRFIMVDYVQLVNNGLENRVNDVSLTSQTLRAMAMKDRLNIPVIAAAQLNRQIEHRGGAPQLHDLRETGSLEQDATIVIFTHPDWPTDPTPDQAAMFPENRHRDRPGLAPVVRAVPVRLYVRKNRNGPVGVTAQIKWCKHTGGYYTLMEAQ